MLTKCTVASAVALAVSQTLTAGTAPYFIPLTKDTFVEAPDGHFVENIDVSAGPDPIREIDSGFGDLFTLTQTGTTTQQRVVDEAFSGPWEAPQGITQRLLTSMEEIETSSNGQTVVRNPGRGNVASMWDMLAYDPSGNYIFIPHETLFGAGVSRYDVANDRVDILFAGDSSGRQGFIDGTDFGAFDPVRYTPNGTIIAGEEWSGAGRLVEYCDPLGAAPTDPIVGPAGTELVAGNCETDPNADYRILDGLPLSAQEGISFSLDTPDDVMYFIDEDNTGSVYKSEFVVSGEYNVAQTFCLSVDSFAASSDDPASSWSAATSSRVGQATWVAITQADGSPIPGFQDPTENILTTGTFGDEVDDAGLAGRLAADDAGCTPFGRPEDTAITHAGNGNELVYFTATSEDAVYSIEETDSGPFVRLAAQQADFGTSAPEEGNGNLVSGTAQNVGFEPTDALFNNPDNLAIDALGNIYVIEDAPNTSSIGADGGAVWFLRDMNNDGVAESLDHFLALSANQSEHTGMIFNPVDPTKFVIAVQHPQSTGLGDIDQDGVRDGIGIGDAMWEFDLTNVAPPECVGPRSNFFTFNPETNRFVRACSSQRDYNVISQMVASEDPNDFPNP